MTTGAWPPPTWSGNGGTAPSPPGGERRPGRSPTSCSGKPVVAVETVARDTGVSTVDAAKALRTLTGAGVVAEFSGHRRNRPWRAPEILSALDEFTRRAGRRR
jgi:hypothetical protein